MNKKISSISIALALTVGSSILASCSTNQTALTNTSAISSTVEKNKLGRLIINLDNLKSSKFSTKATLSDPSITDLKVEVDGLNMDKVIKTFKWSPINSLSSVSVDIPAGKNRVISVTGLDNAGNTVAKLMGLSDISADSQNTLAVNFGTTPAARVMQIILSGSRRDISDKVDGGKLKELITNITNYRDSDNTYFGVNPSNVDVNAISQNIIFNGGDVNPTNTTGLTSSITGKLKMILKDEKGNTILSGVKISLNDVSSHTFTSNGASTTIDADSGVWEITAKAFVNAQGSFTVPINYDDERTIILSGGNIVYAKATVLVKDSSVQDVTMVLKPIKVKEIQLYDGDKKIDSTIEIQLNTPKDFDARVLLEDDSFQKDEVIWEVSDPLTAYITPNGTISALRSGSTSLTVRSIIDRDITMNYNISVRDDILNPVLSSFTPSTGLPGTLVSIQGKNFDDLVPSNNIVRFNGIKADVISSSTELLKVKVPEGPTLGYITIETLKGMVTSDLKFSGNNNENNMVRVAGGTFTMGTAGTTGGPSEHPQLVNKVSVSSFLVDKFEVSNKEYRKFVEANAYNNQDFWTVAGWNWKTTNNITQPLFWNDPAYNQDEQPVVGISWYEASAYAKWSGKRLLTEAEWEYTSRGATGRTYPWGEIATSTDIETRVNGYFGAEGSRNDGFKFLSPIGRYCSGSTPNQAIYTGTYKNSVCASDATNPDSGNRIYDLSGNVSEWVSDWYQFEYYGRDTDFSNPIGPISGQFKVSKGGSWSNDSNQLTSSYRELFFKPESRSSNLGFRCAKSTN